MRNHIIQSEAITLKITVRFIILTISQLILYITLAFGQTPDHLNPQSANSLSFKGSKPIFQDPVSLKVVLTESGFFRILAE